MRTQGSKAAAGRYTDFGYREEETEKDKRKRKAWSKNMNMNEAVICVEGHDWRTRSQRDEEFAVPVVGEMSVSLCDTRIYLSLLSVCVFEAAVSISSAASCLPFVSVP